MGVIGSKWTALLLRDLAAGPNRFSDFERSIPGLNPRTLACRLEDLRAHGIIETCPSADGGAHHSYRLTAKGQDLIPVLHQMARWGAKYSTKQPTVA